MRDHGLEYGGPIIADGKLHRFRAGNGQTRDKARNSWYVLHGGPPAAGAFGCWRRDFKERWCERNGKLSQSELQIARRNWQQADQVREKSERDRQRRSRQIAERILQRSTRVTTHAYLGAKHVQPFGELRETSRGELVLPLRDINGELHSLQFVAPDNRFDGERNKTFLRGGRISGCFFTLADTAADCPLVICEGYATGASIHAATGYATICAMNCGNLFDTAKAVRELWSQRDIIVAADNDTSTDGNPGLTKATAAAKAIRARLAIPQFKDAMSKPTDFNDLATAENLDTVKAQISAAVIPTETDAETFMRLAALSPAEYDRVRKDEAAALGIQLKTLDAEVEKLRGKTGGDLQGSPVDLPDVEPWPDPVDGAEVLNAIANCFSRYVAVPPGAADAIALWAAKTHCFDCFAISPRLNFTSPEKGCGKTVARDVVALLVPRPLPAENVTPAVLFRLIEKHRPVVLADECDAWLRDNEELRGMLNSGHRRGGKVYRCEGDGNEVRAFDVFSPVVLCGIGALSGTLHDRCIVIRLTRAKPSEVAVRFDSRKTAAENELCRKLARWTADKRQQLENCDPKLPDNAYNRLADNWRPLFAIAEAAGGDWPRRAADAFAKLTSTDDLTAQGIGTHLLADIQAVFKSAGADRLFSTQLADKLAEIEGHPWAEFGRQRKPISANQLARLLKGFGVGPRPLRIGEETAKGYLQSDFADAFERYLAYPRLSNRHIVTTPANTQDSIDSEASQPPTMLPFEKAIPASENGHCDGVTFPKPGTNEIVDADYL
jgi:putative DNA primase/helicase